MRNNLGSLNSNWKGGLVECECVVCGTIFKEKRNRAVTRKTCSRECVGVYRYLLFEQKREEKLLKSPYSCSCCGAKLLLAKCRASIYKDNFCNMKCFIEWQKLNRYGVCNSNWRGGVTPLRHAIYNLEEALAWKERVRKRDNFTCRKCGCHSELHVHHLKKFVTLLDSFLRYYDQFSPIEDRDTLVRLATKWKPFWNDSNGLTLCSSCHAKVEKRKVPLGAR